MIVGVSRLSDQENPTEKASVLSARVGAWLLALIGRLSVPDHDDET